MHNPIPIALRTHAPDIQIEIHAFPPRVTARSGPIVPAAVVTIPTPPATPRVTAPHTRSSIVVIVVVDVDVAIDLPIVVAVVVRAAVGRRVAAAAVGAVVIIVGRLMAAIAIAVVVGGAVGTPEELAAAAAAAADVVEIAVRLATLVGR
jgi:hypothetical protein